AKGCSVFASWMQAVLVALVMTCGAQALADDSADRSELADQIRKLGPSNSQEVRLEAVRWVIKHLERPDATDAMPALIARIRNDADAMVRGKAAEALGLIANRQKPKVCPLAIVEAFEDKNEDARQLAIGVSGLFTDFASGSKEILLRCLKKGDRDVRSAA